MSNTVANVCADCTDDLQDTGARPWLARRQWNAGDDPRFGEVSQYPGPERLRAPELPNLRMRPRGRRR